MSKYQTPISIEKANEEYNLTLPRIPGLGGDGEDDFHAFMQFKRVSVHTSITGKTTIEYEFDYSGSMDMMPLMVAPKSIKIILE